MFKHLVHIRFTNGNLTNCIQPYAFLLSDKIPDRKFEKSFCYLIKSLIGETQTLALSSAACVRSLATQTFTFTVCDEQELERNATVGDMAMIFLMRMDCIRNPYNFPSDLHYFVQFF